MTFRDFPRVEMQGNIPKFESRQNHSSLYRKGAKRCLDITLILMTLPISLPLLLGMIALVAIKGGKPIYRQARLGRDGRVFHMFKIRTMVPGADALLASHLEKNHEARREWDETQKLKDDPRVTSIGRFLRKSSLDELPQLWNVLKGDMSLVGPRPMMVEQRAIYPGTAYFELRPGITGPWQISERNTCSFADRAAYDKSYLSSLSLSQDVSILLKTMSVVCRGTGC
jgi:lipopolysaccharide/colanic/teichoic acid biosynthesis glycosyltransferase